MINKLDKLLSKKFRNTTNIKSIAQQMDYSYEEAIRPREIELIEGIADFDNRQQLTIDELNDLPSVEYSPDDREQIPTDEEITIYNKQSDLHYMQHLLEQQLLSLKEMQIIHLYKNFEILLKEMIVRAFPYTKKRDLFKWDNVKETLKSNEVEFTSLNNYQYLNQLRIANNNIKHSSTITDDVKSSIREFSDLDEFEYITLDDFYKRVKPKVDLFLSELSESLLDHLYTFSDDRIKNIAN